MSVLQVPQSKNDLRSETSKLVTKFLKSGGKIKVYKSRRKSVKTFKR